MSDEHLSLARQDSYELDDSSSDPGVSNPVDKDEELVRRAQNDDPWAIEQLVLRYQKKVYQIAYQMLAGDEQEAQDLTQDAFLKAFRKIKQFKGNASFYTWLVSHSDQHVFRCPQTAAALEGDFFPLAFGKR